VVPYMDPEELMRYPMNYNDNYVDNFSASFTNAGVNYSRSGNVTTTVDGYGDIVLPYGTITDVLRLKYEEDYKDEFTIIGVPYTLNYQSEIYAWYKPGIHVPVMAITKLTSDAGNTEYGLFLDASVGFEQNSIENEVASIYPNPVSHKAIYSVKSDNKTDFELTLINALGQELEVLFVGQIEAGQNNINIDLGEYQKGSYLIKARSGDQVSILKLLKQ